ncbi:MAG: nuclease-related domain-containing protein [Chloroflexota bacterium]
MRNMVPARALARRSRNLALLAVFVFVLGIFTFIVSSFLNTVPLIADNTPNANFYQLITTILSWTSGILIALSVVMFIRAFTWKRDNPIAAQVGDILERELNLDDRYAYIRNLSRSQIGYVDAVLVGPPGVLVMRIVNRGGVFFNEGAKWLKQKDKANWTPLRWSPSQEVATDVTKIREFLRTRSYDQIPVFAVVVFTEDEPQTRVTTENPTVPVMQPFEMAYSLENSYFADRSRLDQLKVNNVIKSLFG